MTLTLTDEIDVSRGDIISGIDNVPLIAAEASARLFWSGEQSLERSRSYFLKIGPKTISATIEGPFNVVNSETMRLEAAEELVLNAVGNVTVHFDRALVFDPYRDDPETGAFILIDRVSLDTVGIGLLL